MVNKNNQDILDKAKNIAGNVSEYISDFASNIGELVGNTIENIKDFMSQPSTKEAIENAEKGVIKAGKALGEGTLNFIKPKK